MEKFLTDHVCLVTGGAQGLGWAISLALADHGASVYACDVSEENLARAGQELASLPWADRITLSQCDVAERPEIEGWIAQVHQSTGRVDVLVNNAAFVCWEDVADMSVEDAIRTMRVGYDGMVYGIKAVLPLMQAAGRGHIINLGSSAGRVFAGSSSAAYSAAKAAIGGYTQILQSELKGSPIHATLVRPATITGTDFFRKHVPSTRMPRLADFLPYVTPPQVATAVVRAIRDRRAILDIPGYLHVFYLLFDLAPRLMGRLMTMGGSARRDYGNVEWSYATEK